MNNLIDKIADYKRVTQTLLNKTNEYEKWVKENIPFEFWRKFGLSRFGNSSNYEYYISVDGKIIPSVVGKLKTSFYWGNDFNCHYAYVSPEELIDWCKSLPTLIKEANDYIGSLTQAADDTLSKINL